MELLTAGPDGHTYPLVSGADRATVAECLGVLDIIDDTGNIVVASQLPSQPHKLGPRLNEQIQAGRGIAVQMPDLQAVGFAGKPLSVLCEPPVDWVMTVGVLFTDSLHEARAWLPTPSSFILREPRDGWLETKSSLGWGVIAAAAAVVAVGGWWVLR